MKREGTFGTSLIVSKDTEWVIGPFLGSVFSLITLTPAMSWYSERKKVSRIQRYKWLREWNIFKKFEKCKVLKPKYGLFSNWRTSRIFFCVINCRPFESFECLFIHFFVGYVGYIRYCSDGHLRQFPRCRFRWKWKNEENKEGGVWGTMAIWVISCNVFFCIKTIQVPVSW